MDSIVTRSRLALLANQRGLMKLPNLTAVIGFQSDGKGLVTIQFKSADGRSHYIPIKAGALNALVPMLVNIQKSTDENGASMDVQPATLTSARSAYGEDGSPMLEIGLDDLMLRVVLDRPGAISKLQKLLAEFQERAGQSHARH